MPFLSLNDQHQNTYGWLCAASLVYCQCRYDSHQSSVFSQRTSFELLHMLIWECSDHLIIDGLSGVWGRGDKVDMPPLLPEIHMLKKFQGFLVNTFAIVIGIFQIPTRALPLDPTGSPNPVLPSSEANSWQRPWIVRVCVMPLWSLLCCTVSPRTPAFDSTSLRHVSPTFLPPPAWCSQWGWVGFSIATVPRGRY